MGCFAVGIEEIVKDWGIALVVLIYFTLLLKGYKNTDTGAKTKLVCSTSHQNYIVIFDDVGKMFKPNCDV